MNHKLLIANIIMACLNVLGLMIIADLGHEIHKGNRQIREKK
jgi:hypothetical protein